MKRMLTLTLILVALATFAGVGTAQKGGPPQLTVIKMGGASGKVTSQPAGINCGPDCTGDYAMGTVVTLTAQPNPGSVFTGWSGACTSTDSSTSVTMTGSKSCTATFNPAPPVSLTVTKMGSGTVTSNPAGINCGPTCTGCYSIGAVVTLEAQSDRGFVFAGWSGDCTGKASSTSVTMTAAKSCTANFGQLPR